MQIHYLSFTYFQRFNNQCSMSATRHYFMISVGFYVRRVLFSLNFENESAYQGWLFSFGGGEGHAYRFFCKV